MKYILPLIFIFLFSFAAHGQNCTYSLSTTNIQVGRDTAASVSVQVTAPDGCAWTSVSDKDWIVISNGATGSGNGTVQLAINVGSSFDYDPQLYGRGGTLTIAGQVVSVYQNYECMPLSYSGSFELYFSAPASGGVFPLNLAYKPGCIYYTMGTSNIASVNLSDKTVTFYPNQGPAQSGLTLIRYTTYQGFKSSININLRQNSGCHYGVFPVTQNFTQSGGAGNFFTDRSNNLGCYVGTPTSNVSWITFTTGTYSSVTYYTVAPNPGGPRTGVISIVTPEGTLTHTVMQSDVPCSYTINPTFQLFSALNEYHDFTVSTQPGCTWLPIKNSSFITGYTELRTGNGTVSFGMLDNPGPGRSGTVTIADKTITLSQASGCAFAPLSTTASIPAVQTNSTFIIQAYPGCIWNPVSQVDWITPTSGSWSGSGTLAYTVAANPLTQPRTGTITAGGNTFTITQTGGAKSRKRTRFF